MIKSKYVIKRKNDDGKLSTIAITPIKDYGSFMRINSDNNTEPTTPIIKTIPIENSELFTEICRSKIDIIKNLFAKFSVRFITVVNSYEADFSFPYINKLSNVGEYVFKPKTKDYFVLMKGSSVAIINEDGKSIETIPSMLKTDWTINQIVDIQKTNTKITYLTEEIFSTKYWSIEEKGVLLRNNPMILAVFKRMTNIASKMTDECFS